MRILVSFPGEHLTGASRYAAAICGELLSRGHQVLAAVHGDGPAKALFSSSAEGIDVRRLDTPNLARGPLPLMRHALGIVRGSRELERVIGEFHPDVVLAHCVFNVWSAIAAKRTGTPLVALLHELPTQFPRPLFRIWAAQLGRRAHRVIVSSDEMLRAVRGLMPRTLVVPPGIDPEEFHPAVDGSAARAELLASNGGPLVVCVSHLMESKGQLDFVTAVPRLAEANPAIRVAFVGGTNGRPGNERFLARLKDRVRGLGIERNVVFTGARREIAPVLAAADLVVVCSRQESFGLIPLEALAVGTPVVATDVGVAHALSKTRPDVHVVPPSDSHRLASAIAIALARPREPKPLEEEWTIRKAVDSIERALIEAAEKARLPGPVISPVRRAVGLVAERVSAPSPDGIRSVNLATTYYCNSRCTMCSIWELYRKDRSRAAAELSLEDIQAIFSSRRFLGLRSIALTGGEPFLRRDLVDIAGFFLTQHSAAAVVIPTDSVSPKLTIRSVGRILERYAPSKDRLSITVSLDGLRETHNRQRGLDCFDNALMVIENLARLSLTLQVSYTITPLNIGDILATYRLARERGASFSMQFGQASSHYYGERSTSPHSWSEDELERVQAQIAEIADDRWAELGTKSRLMDVSDYFMRHMVDYQRSPRRIFTCYSGTHSVFIDPYGDVYPCLMLDRKLGNAKADGFDAVWDGPEAVAVRRFISERKCHCWTPCEAGPSLGRSLGPQLRALSKLHKKERARSCA